MTNKSLPIAACALSFLFVVSCPQTPPQPLPSLDSQDFRQCLGGAKPGERLNLFVTKRGQLNEDALITTLSAAKQENADTGAPLGMWSSIGELGVVSDPGSSSDSYYPIAGRVNAIAIDPVSPDNVVVGTANGGVWQRTQGKWKPISDLAVVPAMGIGAIAFDPSHNNIIYAATGEPFVSSGYGGYGLLKSEDSGTSWKLLANDRLEPLAFTSLKVNPNNGKELVATTQHPTGKRCYFNHYRARNDPGILRSEDGGEAWQPAWTDGFSNDVDALDLAVNPSDFSQQVATIGQNFVFSTNGGRFFERVDGPWNRGVSLAMKVAIAPSNPNVVYVAGYDSSGLSGVWRLSDFWNSPSPSVKSIWTAGIDENFCGAQCWYNLTLSVDPDDESVLFLGGVLLWKYEKQAWTKLHGHNEKAHPDQHVFVWDQNKCLWIGNDGGVYQTCDKGKTFKSLNAGLNIGETYLGSISPDGKRVMRGMQDNGTSVALLSGDQWIKVSGGDGFANVFSKSYPNSVITTSQQGRIDLLCTGTFGRAYSYGVRAGESASPFETLLAQCSADDRQITIRDKADALVMNSNIFGQCDFFSQTYPWTDLGAISQLSSLQYFPFFNDCQSIVAGTSGGAVVMLSTQNGQKQTIARLGNYINDFAFKNSRQGELVAYVAVGGYANNHLYRLSCMGCDFASATLPLSWQTTRIGPAANTPHNAVAYHEKSDRLFAGTDVGVFVLENASSCKQAPCDWKHFGPAQGIPYVIVHDIQIHEASGTVVAFTHGRGAYKLESP
jgi:hypothetical protein